MSTQVRLDGADTGFFRVMVALNGVTELDNGNGLHVVDGSPSPDYASFSVSGVLRMESGDFISVWVYADEDVSYRANTQSGFSCALLEAAVGFSSKLVSPRSLAAVAGWVEVRPASAALISPTAK